MQPKHTLTKTCDVCGALFERHEGERPIMFAKRRTCGIACGRKLAWQDEPRRARASVQSKARQPRVVPPSKTCAACGSKFSRRDDEANNQFAKRIACSKACADALTARAQAKPDTSEKTCIICGAVFVKRPDETNANFHKRQTCGTDCGLTLRGQQRSRPVIERACVECGVILERRPKEAPSAYAGRQTCSRACFSDHLSKVLRRVRERLPVRYSLEWTHELREAIRDRDGRQCVLCGATEGRKRLPVHHISYDKQDCRPSNLVTLCDSCHMKTNFDREQWRDLLSALMASLDRDAQPGDAA